MAYDFEKMLDELGAHKNAAPATPPTPETAPRAEYDFDAMLDDLERPKNLATSASIFEASFSNPDHEAERRKLAKSMGQYLGGIHPPSTIDIQDAQRRVRAAEADHATRASPRTQAWFSSTENAKLAVDDAKTLAEIESAATGVANFGKSIWKGLAYGAPAGIAGAAAAPFDVVESGLSSLGVPEDALKFFPGRGLRGLADIAKRGGESLAIPKADGVVASGIQSGAESLGMNIATLPFAVLRSPEFALRLMALSSGGASYLEARDEGAGPLRALSVAAPDAVAEYATEKLGLKALFDTAAFKNAFLKQAGKFALLEMGGEQVATVWQDANKWLVMNPEKSLSEFLAERPAAAVQTAIATLVGAGGQIAIARGLDALSGAGARPIEARAAQIGQLFDLATQSKLNTRSPEDFASFFQSIGEDAFVYVEPKQLLDTLTEAGVPSEVGQKLLAGREEGAVFGQVEIPVADLVTGLQGTGAEKAIIQHLRVGDPNAMTLAEAKEAGTKAAEFFQRDAERIVADESAKQEFRDSAKRVREDIATRLAQAAPFHSAQQARDLATHLGAFYEVLAHDLGVTPEQIRDGWTDAQGKAHRGYRPAFLNAEQYAAKRRGEDLAQDSARLDGALEAAQTERRQKPRVRVKDIRYYKEGDEADRTAKIGEFENFLFQNEAPTFYSQLARAFEGAKQGAMPAGQWLSWLDANRSKLGVKNDEIEWTGVREWLELRGKEKTSKADIAEFLKENGVQVEEVVKGAPKAVRIVSDGEGEFNIVDENDTVLDSGLSYQQAQKRLSGVDSPKAPTKFESYIPPGGEAGTYRELLLTLPIATGERTPEEELRFNYLTSQGYSETDPYTGEEMREEIRALRGKSKASPGFKSGHWDESNVLAHIRFDEVTDADGQRRLRVIEIQSDWGQKARGTPGGVPPAPFVTDTKAWTGLAIKRMIRYAAENGYEGVVFATGQQNADLYDLSKQVGELAYWKEGEEYGLSAVDPQGGMISSIDQLYLKEGELEGAVGKEVAKQIIDDSGDVESQFGFPADPNVRYLRGPDLKVGGEGMRAFYDQIVPQVANDILKKIGGGKVVPVEIDLRRPEDDSYYETPTDADFSKQPGFDITDEMREAVMRGLPLFQPQSTGAKGAFDPETLDIAFLAKADLSTFTHEVGHFFLTVYADVASQPDAPAAIKDRVHAVLDHFGVADLAAWNAMSLDQQRKYHEQFAESWEAYILTGEAPSQKLVPIYRRMSEYVKSVYRSVVEFLRGHPTVKIDPGLKAVMDRMIATEEEIDAMQAQRNYVALFKNQADSGMTPEQWAAYQELAPEAKQEAEDMLRSRSMRDLKWLQNMRNRKIAELQKEAEAERAAMREEVRKELEQQPIYRAMRWLQLGETTDADGNEVKATEGFKLSLDSLAEMFPEGALDRPDLSKLGRGKYSLAAKGGLHPDMVAEMFGFNSGESMVRQLIDAPKLQGAIESETDARMLMEHSDLVNPDEIARAADEAIHNTVRTRMVATELWALNKNVGSPSALMKAAKEYARQMLGNKTGRNLKPWFFAAEEVRAGKAAVAALAKGDREAAAKHKRTELVNHVAAKEAHAALREMEKIEARLRKIAGYKDDASAVKTRDQDIVNAARAIIAEFGIGQKGERARSYLEVVSRQNPDLGEVLADLVDEATQTAKELDKLTLNEMRDLSSVVEAVWRLAKRSRQMEVDGKVVDRATVAKELYDRMAEIGIPDRIPGEGSAVTTAEKRSMDVGTFRGMLRRVEFWVEAKDGLNPMGPFRKYVWSQIRDAVDAYTADKVRVLKAYKALLKGIEPSLKRQLIDAPEIGYVFGKAEGGLAKVEILHAILHTGNMSNKRKLLLGRGWAVENADGSLDTSKWDTFIQRMVRQGVLTKADFDFAQGVWDLLESMKPAAQKAHRDVFGRYFDEVTANEFVDPFGVKRRGGYVPAMTDADVVPDAQLRELAERENETLRNAFPATSRGFTKSRVESYTKPLKLDLRLLSTHIDKVLLFSHLTQPVNDVRRLLMDKQVSQPLSRIDPAAIPSILNPWLNRTAKQVVEVKRSDAGQLGRFWSAARRNSGMLAMFANVANAAQQITGFSLAAVKVKPKYLVHAMAQYAAAPKGMTKYVAELSPYMATRLENEAVAMSGQINDILLKPSVLESAKNWTVHHGYFLQSAVDSVMSPIVWLGAYNAEMERSGDPLTARRLADAAVRETQGAQAPVDIAAYEVGSPFYRMFTQFTGYFNMNANMLGTEFSKATNDIGLKKGAGRGLYVFVLGFLAPAIVGQMIVSAFRGGPDDDDRDGEYLDDWLMDLFVVAPTRYATAMVPVVGHVANAAISSTNEKPYDDRITAAPAITMVESAVRAPMSVYKAIAEEGKPSKAIRDVATLVGMTLGVPSVGVAKPVGYVADVVSGNVEPTGPLDLARGIVTGAASPQSKQ